MGQQMGRGVGAYRTGRRTDRRNGHDGTHQTDGWGDKQTEMTDDGNATANTTTERTEWNGTQRNATDCNA